MAELRAGRAGDRFGMWAALGALAASLAYGLPQIAQVAGLLRDPWDRILIFAPSLILAPAFVLTMAAVHAAAPPARQVWSLSALALAILYAGLVSIVYVTQLGVVIPHDLSGQGESVRLFACCATGQFLTGVDLLGYTLMSLSTLFAAPVFPGRGLRRWLRLALMANGVLAPVLIGQLAWPQLIYAGALWLATFPAAMALLAAFFRRAVRH